MDISGISSSNYNKYIFGRKNRKSDKLEAVIGAIAGTGVGLLCIFVLAKFPLLKNIPFEKALPFLYAYCGYKAGKTK